MRLPILVTLALFGVAFSGCLAGVGTITAKEGLDPALEAAEAFAGGSATLVGVSSLEPLKHYEDEMEDFEVNVYLDDNPGDGLAPGWAYEFIVGNDYVIIGYASGLGVLFEAREGGDEEDVDAEFLEEIAITGWKIDSDDAAKALKANESWPAPTDSTSYFWYLSQEEECPVWSVEAVDLDENWTMAEVDACTGEVLHVGGPESFFQSCMWSWSSGSGSAAPVLGGGSSDVYLDFPGMVAYEVDIGGVTFGDVSWNLVGPNGLVAEGTTSAADVLEEMDPGYYTLTVEAGTGASTNVSRYLEASGCS